MKKILSILSILVILPVLSACHLSSWLTYTNTAYGFELQYPGGGGGILPGATDTDVRILLPIAPGTNLLEKYLDISVTDGAATCESPNAAGYAPGSLVQTTLNIDGITWVKEGAGEGAAGNFYQWIGYSTVSGSVCVSLTFVLHSANPGVYSTPPPTFDEAGESVVFGIIVGTFHWLSGAAITPEEGGWLTYTNLAFGFQLQYPPGGGGLQPGDTAAYARIDLPFADGTNLSEKYLAIDVGTDPDDCGSPYSGGPTPVPTTLTIGGLEWMLQEGGEGAAGSIYQWTTYSTISGSVCVSLSFIRHSHPPDLWPTPPPTYDEAAETAVFVQIVETFIWLSGDAVTPTPPSITSTPTPVLGAFFRPHMNAYCRSGPDPAFSSIGLAMEGERYPIDGRNQEDTYYLVFLTKNIECWVLKEAGEASGDLGRIRVMLPIPTPTFTPPPPQQQFDCSQYDNNYKACFSHLDVCTWQGQTGAPTGKCVNK